MSGSHSHQLLEDFHVVVPVSVQWGDADMLGHVNNTVYFRWFETGRIEYFQRVSLWEQSKVERIGPILASAKCDFLKQVSFPDTVRIGTRVTRIGKSSMSLEHKIYSETQEAIVAQGESIIVCFDYAKNVTHPVPARIREYIEKLEGTTF
ncbi:MAG: thioesterase family protein [Planctomycetota bacterium]